ncbi:MULTISPECIES: hypothetical protein [Pseudomonas]|uniref:hypothetical protein n=1 Tax=Pseudomonas TaxID=286 RepID=UPI00177E0E11|nr:MULTISPECIES: hypothetical protein [Pseudomonas]MBD8671661.1 hypothetical protein [Pseudomonas lurida]QSL90466.1 hypothetical protein JWU58_26880 [Pseudomonas atacamensis]
MKNLFIVSPLSAGLLAHRMRFLGNAELLADTFEFNPPPGFDAESWADMAQALEQDLNAAKAIELTPPAVVLLVESLEGNSFIGLAPPSKREGLRSMAKLLAERLEPHMGRPVRPELS